MHVFIYFSLSPSGDEDYFPLDTWATADLIESPEDEVKPVKITRQTRDKKKKKKYNKPLEDVNGKIYKKYKKIYFFFFIVADPVSACTVHGYGGHYAYVIEGGGRS